MAFEYKSGPLSEADTFDDVCDRGNTTDKIIEPAGLDLADSEKIRLGTGNDATIYYDDTNLVIDPKVVGTGYIDTNTANLKTGHIGIGQDPLISSNIYISKAISTSGYIFALKFSSSLTSLDNHVYAAYFAPVITIPNSKVASGLSSAIATLTVSAGTGKFHAISALEPSTLVGTLGENIGLKLYDYIKGTSNYAIYAGLGDVSLGDDLVLRNDSDKIYLGAAKDAYLEFDGNSLNIAANAVTGTDDLNLTADDLNLSADLVFADAKDITFNTTTGTKIGTATAQKLAFYNALPVDQPVTVADAATQDLTGGDTVDKTKLEADLTSCKDTVNAVIDRLQELGLIA